MTALENHEWILPQVNKKHEKWKKNTTQYNNAHKTSSHQLNDRFWLLTNSLSLCCFSSTSLISSAVLWRFASTSCCWSSLCLNTLSMCWKEMCYIQTWHYKTLQQQVQVAEPEGTRERGVVHAVENLQTSEMWGKIIICKILGKNVQN